MEVRRALPADPVPASSHAPAITHDPAPAAPHPLAALPATPQVAPPGAATAHLGAGAAGLGELAIPQAPVAQAQTAGPGAQPGGAAPTGTDAQEQQRLAQGLETLKGSKTLLKPDQKGPEVLLIQQQLKHLGLHVKETGVLDKSTEGYIKAIQTGGGLGADGVVGPKTVDELQKLDSSAHKPPQTAPDPAAGGGTTGDNVDHIPDDPKLAAIYLFNRQRAASAQEDLTPAQQKDMEQFIKNWDQNKARYEKAAAASGVPAKLIATLHWRESTGDFGTYLHQGDPLGKKAVHEPSDIPLFKEWEPAAEHALGLKASVQRAYKIDAKTTDEAALASYAERYNGTGYFDYHAMASPYVFSGTDQYQKGKYRSDGGAGFDPNYKDTQLGVLPMLRRIDQHEKELHEKELAAKAAQQAAAQGPNQHFAQ